MDCHVPTVTGTAICVCTLPFMLDRLRVLVVTCSGQEVGAVVYYDILLERLSTIT